jgi:hypothetical protein
VKLRFAVAMMAIRENMMNYADKQTIVDGQIDFMRGNKIS